MKRCLAFLLVMCLNPRHLTADCVCKCVDGQFIPVCSSTLDIPPICPPRICPMPPPAIKPLPSLSIPPLGTSTAVQAQVFDEDTGEYEYEELYE